VLFGAKFSSAANFGGISLITAGGLDTAVAKLSGATGATLWAKAAGSTGTDSINGLAVDRSGNAVLTGQAGGPINFGGGLIGSGGVFVAKYSGLNGSYQWAKVLAGVAGDGIATDLNTGNIFVTGQGSGGIFLNAYDPSGNSLWAKAFGSSSDAGLAVCVDANGNLAITGQSGSMFLDFAGTGSYLVGGAYYVASFTTSGTFLWAQRPSSNGGTGTGITYDLLGHVLTTGNYHGTANFGGISI